MLKVVTVNEVGFDVMATVDFDVDLEVQGTYGPQVGFKYVKDEGFKPMAGGAFPDLELEGDGVIAAPLLTHRKNRKMVQPARRFYPSSSGPSQLLRY